MTSHSHQAIAPDENAAPPMMSTLTEHLERCAARFGDKTFVVFGDNGHSYAEVLADSRRWASGFHLQGVRAGEVIASLTDTCHEGLLTMFGVVSLGAIWLPINTAFKGEFLRHQLHDATVSRLIVDSRYAQRIADIIDELPQLRQIIYLGDRPAQPELQDRLTPIARIDAGAAELPEIRIKPGDLAALLYTSGTTGPSKGCMISHNYLYNVGRQSRWIFRPEDILYCPMPLFHLNGLTMLGAISHVGATMVFDTRFSVSEFWPSVERCGATAVNLMGATIPFIADAPDTEESHRCFGQVRLLLGAPFPPAMRKVWADRFGLRDVSPTGYGQTEANLVTTNDGGDYPAGSIGPAAPEFEVRIFDDDGNEAPPGGVGEIVCRPRRSHVMFEGYWNRPADTLKAMRGLWFHTGDLGRMDDDGFLYFVDRKKDYLRRRGENISSFEVEAVFMRHPEVAEVAAHAVFAKASEDDLKVTIVLTDGATVTEEKLCLWSSQHLPFFAVPRYIEFRPELPRNAVGRVTKYKLREEGCTERTWDLEKSTLRIERT